MTRTYSDGYGLTEQEQFENSFQQLENDPIDYRIPMQIEIDYVDSDIDLEAWYSELTNHADNVLLLDEL